MADDNGVVTGAPGEDTAVADVVLDVADHGSLGDGSDREDVADDENDDEDVVDDSVGEGVTIGELGELPALGV